MEIITKEIHLHKYIFFQKVKSKPKKIQHFWSNCFLKRSNQAQKKFSIFGQIISERSNQAQKKFSIFGQIILKGQI